MRMRIIGRQGRRASTPSRLGPFQPVSAQRVLLEDDKPVRLSGRAFDMLAALVEHAGRVVGREALIDRAWPQTFLEETSLQIEVSALWCTEVELYDARGVQQILDSVPTAAWRPRSDGFTEYINKRWLEYAGISLEQALAWQWLAIIRPDDDPHTCDI